jgi:alpha-N-arabinofuranosidase
VAPPILEEVYTMADALAFGGACIALLNHADRVQAACLAQLVNAIAPIMTETGGGAWRQTIFWPFAQWSRHGRGQVLRAECDSPTYDVRYFDPRGPIDQWFPIIAPLLKLGAVRQDDGGLSLFAVNRDLEEAMPLDIATPGFADLELVEAATLHHADLDAANTAADPDRVVPGPLAGVGVAGGHVSATLPPASWNLLRLRPRT